MRGTGQNRTGVRGFAGRCLTTRPRCRVRNAMESSKVFSIPSVDAGLPSAAPMYRCTGRDARNVLKEAGR